MTSASKPQHFNEHKQAHRRIYEASFIQHHACKVMPVHATKAYGEMEV
jgi:hypothetical protein